MSKFRFHLSVSADGYLAGPDQSEENPLGVGGEQLHEWVVLLEAWRKHHGKEGGEVNASTLWWSRRWWPTSARGNGPQHVRPGCRRRLGRRVPRGWWGDDPPFHHPVFVLTHHERQPLEMEEHHLHLRHRRPRQSALEQARDAGDGKDVQLHRWCQRRAAVSRRNLIDEFELHVVPLLLGGGERLLDNVGDLQLDGIRAVEAPGVSHVKYRVVK